MNPRGRIDCGIVLLSQEEAAALLGQIGRQIRRLKEAADAGLGVDDDALTPADVAFLRQVRAYLNSAVLLVVSYAPQFDQS